MSLDLERFDIQNLENIHQYYKEHGFVIVRQVLSEKLLAEFSSEYGQLVEINLKKAGIASALTKRDLLFISEGIKLLEEANHSWVSDIYDISAMLPNF